ncbi:MAG: phosphoadenosine phosphosulfate reductase family protein [Alphaproteobacteria bacterium]|nr:phosphoadenosine phosphosulfate reductase family protein [Alphaproteobacteria bacterium]
MSGCLEGGEAFPAIAFLPTTPGAAMQFDFYETSEFPVIEELIAQGALFVVNHSGGKDSQAMFLRLRTLVPADQLLVIHADLPGADWAGTWEHVVATVAPLVPIKTTSVKTFLQMVENRGMWPGPTHRQCTSDLKRNPIERDIRRFLKANPRFNGLIVNCMGLRAEESTRRAKAVPFKRSERNSKAGRNWFDWLPIFQMSEAEVFAEIERAGEQPHWAYTAGMSRLSCMFCIMASRADLRIAAELNPEPYAQYVALERQIDHAFIMPRKGQPPQFLEDYTGVMAQPKPRRQRQ